MSKQLNCSVTGTPTDTPHLRVDDGTEVTGVFESASRVIFRMADAVPPWGATITFGGKEVRTLIPVYGAEEGPLLAYAPPTLALHISSDRRTFHLPDGSRWMYAIHSDFRLLQRFLAGDDLSGLLAERKAAGSHGARVFGMCKNLFSLDPRFTPGYYDSLTTFAAYMAAQGMYVEYVAFCDAQGWGWADQSHHWNRVGDALRDSPNVLIELVNEYQQNGIDPSRFGRLPIANLQSRGSSVGDVPPAMPAWDFSTFHPRRDWKWPFTVAATANEIYAYPGLDVPCAINEPIGAAEVPSSGRRASDPALFEKMAVDCALWAAGGCFHSDGGLGSDAWGPVQTACAEAFFRGLAR